MKGIISKVFLVLLLTGLCCGTAFAASAKVTYVKGKVEVNRGNAWVAVKVGDEIKEAETISTGFQSEARLNYNGSVMAVPALSRVTLETLQTSSTKDTVSIKVDTGAVRSKVTHTEGKRIEYSARTSVAVASVRGTDFLVFNNGKSKVFSGAIAYYPIKFFVPPVITKETVQQEENGEEADSADQGPANATTPAGEIVSSAPKKSTVVGAGQQSKMNKKGQSTDPFEEAKKRNKKAKTALATAAEQDAMNSGAGEGSSADTSKQTGGLSLTFVFPN